MQTLMLPHQQGWLACVAAGWDGHKAQPQTLMLARAGGPLSRPFEDHAYCYKHLQALVLANVWPKPRWGEYKGTSSGPLTRKESSC